MRILITGKNSYIGTSFETWLKQYGDKYQVHSIDVKGEDWKQHDFSQYDVVFNVAGIVHINEKKVDRALYFKVNRDLAIELAKTAKKAGVKQFVQMSTMAVFGLEGKIGESIIIDHNTTCLPKSAYGKSKLEADINLLDIENEVFKVCCVRPPMVYGPNCVGNYALLSQLVKRLPVFPLIENQRSMIFINNLADILMKIMNEREQGIVYPQDHYYVSTKDMVRFIVEARGKSIHMSKSLGYIVLRVGRYIGVCHKVFGNLTYANDLVVHSKGNLSKSTLQENIYSIEVGG